MCHKDCLKEENGFMAKKSIYISGKITGLSKEEYRAKFDQAERKLRHEGFLVFNPTDPSWTNYFEERKSPYEVILWHDLRKLMECDAIYMLDNFLESKGAKAEFAYAIATGKEIIYDEELYNNGTLRR